MAEQGGAGEQAGAWSRVGQAMGTAGDVAQRMWARNLNVWSEIAKGLDEGPYSADKFAHDAGRMMGLTQQTIEDLWAAAVNPFGASSMSYAVPTVFLYFGRSDSGFLLPSVAPTVAAPLSAGDLADISGASIALDGPAATAAAAAPGGDAQPGDAAAALPPSDALDVTLSAPRVQGKREFSVLAAQTKTQGAAATGGGLRLSRLAPGAYSGVVYLEKPALVLAQLRIVVADKPAAGGQQ